MRVLLWHVHGSWTTAFVQGRHDYLLPVVPDRGPDGRGRARTWCWPSTVRELSPSQLADADIDVVVIQRPWELHGLVPTWTGRRPGVDLPAVYVEHDAPQGRLDDMRHPAADRPDLRIVHVTHFNDLFWDCGSTPTTVVEHGVIDPGPLYTGELSRVGVVVNEPVRRGRVAGTDLLPRFGEAVQLDVFGMAVAAVPALAPGRIRAHEDLSQSAMHAALAHRRAYLHTMRWTSLGLSLIEAMHLGMPVAALATTGAMTAVSPGAGVLSNDPAVLIAALQKWLADPDEAAEVGREARRVALERFNIGRFLDDWDRILQEVTS